MPKRKTPRGIDWPAIKREYIAGQMTLEEIASQHGITRFYICKTARKYGWPDRQGLRATILRRTEQLLVNEESTAEGIELAAARGAQVIREHRVILAKLRSIIAKLTAEMIEVLATKLPPKPTARQVREHLAKRAALLTKLKICTDAIAKLIPLERLAFNLNQENSGDDLESLLRRLNAER